MSEARHRFYSEHEAAGEYPNAVAPALTKEQIEDMRAYAMRNRSSPFGIHEDQIVAVCDMALERLAPVETRHYADGTSATGRAPLPDHSPVSTLSTQLRADAEGHAPRRKARLLEAADAIERLERDFERTENARLHLIRILESAQKDAKAARDALEHNLGLANGTARKAQAERDDMIRTLRKSYSAIQIAEMVGLTRQRVHQILNEASEPDCEACPGPAFVRQHGGTCCQL